MSFDYISLLSIIIALTSAGITILLVVFSVQTNNRKKKLERVLAVIDILILIITTIFAIIGFVNHHSYYNGSRFVHIWHYSSWVASGFSCGALLIVLISFVIYKKGAKPNTTKKECTQEKNAQKKVVPSEGLSSKYTDEQIDKLKKELLEEFNIIQSKQVKEEKTDGFFTHNKKTILITASSNCGVGLWTSICVFFASIFGVESTNYTKKMNRVVDSVKRKMIEKMNKYPDYEFGDFRIVKEKGLVYSGSVIGVLKKEKED